MAHDVFISYSTHDKPVADAICAGLEAKGIRCWIAPRDILAGMEWGHSIVDAIGSAKVMVLLLSANANKSPQIPKEVDRAVNKGVPVLPLRIEDVQPAGALEYYLGPAHWLDAITPPVQAHIERLAETINALLKRAATARLSSPGNPGERTGAPAQPSTPEPSAAFTPVKPPSAPPPVPQRSAPVAFAAPLPPPAPSQPSRYVAPQASPIDDGIKILLYIVAAVVPIVGIILFFVYNNSTFESDRKMSRILLIIGIIALGLSVMFGCLCAVAQEGTYS